MPQNTPPPGWYQDPTGFGEGRYWDGTSWTQSVSRAGQTVDVPMEPGRAHLPPIPGSELTAPPVATAPTTVTVERPKRSAFGAIVGVIGIILLVVVIIAIVNNSDDSSNDESPPATSPATTAAPANDG